MKVTNIVNIDLSIRQNIPFVDAVQGDSARAIEFRLFDKGQPFDVPDGSAVLIRYKRHDGFGGVYDTLPNGEPAYSINANKVTAVLSPTALGVAGNVGFQIAVSNGEDLISAFALEVRVDADPSFDSVDAEDYINISQFVTEESKKNAPYIGDNGNWWVNQEDTGVKAGGGSGGGGADGFSPIANVTQTDRGATITITDKNGTTTATVTNGKDGKDGEKGDTGATGAKGDKGDPGADGKDGTNGKDGTSVTVKSVSESTADGGSNVVTFSDGKTVTIKNGSKGSTGSKGDKGDKGDTGATGAAGKTAYQYAQDGGYTGTEEAFAAKIAAEYTENPLYGKKVTFNGDSICAGYDGGGGYGAIIANRNNMTYENIAHGGATITAETYSGSTGNALHWICRTISQMSADSDYAIVEGGINDPNYVTNMGSLSEGFDAVLDDTTYYGAFESMLKQLVTRFAGKKIGYIAIPKVSANFDSRGDSDNCYHIALECCEKWGVPVCDLNTCVPPLGYIDALSSAYTTDGTHPNEAGYKAYYCDQIEAWMKNLTATSKSAKSAVKEHNTDAEAHTDIRGLLKKLQQGKLNSEGVSVKTIRTSLADGTLVDIDVLVVSEGAAVIPYTNRVPTSIGTDGAVYNGVGYKNGYRLNSSGTEKELVSASVTGFIKAKAGDTIRIKGYKWYNTTAATCYLCAYNGDFSKAYVGNAQSNYDTTAFIESMNYDEATGISTVVLKPGLSYEYIRLNVFDNLIPDGANLIVTVNEEITE